MKNEARVVAILKHPRTHNIVGSLYLWNTGEADPMWIDDEILSATAEPTEGESESWSNWRCNE